MQSALHKPDLDPTNLFEIFRGIHATEILTAAVAHFDVFGILSNAPCSHDALAKKLNLADRPALVFFTALRAMGLLLCQDGKYSLSEMAKEHLVPHSYFDVGDYIGLAAQNPSVLSLVERLKTNEPAGAKDNEGGTAFIFRQGKKSAMEQSEMARHLTLALSGRAKNVAPYFAEQADLENAEHLLDIGGGTGIYSIACLQKHPQLRATVLDRPEVLKICQEMAESYGVKDRITLLAGDMFDGHYPKADVILLSNVLHDWDVPECQKIIQTAAAVLPTGGRLLIHDVFLNDALDGPLPIALYSVALFQLTEGRAYSCAEYRNWLLDADLKPEGPKITSVHCGILTGRKA